MKQTTQSAKHSTAFRDRVYAVLVTIPAGNVTTYGALAEAVSCGSPRAVGQALRNNPYAPEVPCHRVIRSDGSLGGFFGKNNGEALLQKRRLLEAEGIVFDSSGKVSARFILRKVKAGMRPPDPETAPPPRADGGR